MSSEEQRIAIAKAIGWQINDLDSGKALCNPKGEIVNAWYNESWRLPDFLNDLNAMHEAWQKLTVAQHHEFRFHLSSISARDGHVTGPCRSVANATAAQRAEAFLRALGLWKD